MDIVLHDIKHFGIKEARKMKLAQRIIFLIAVIVLIAGLTACQVLFNEKTTDIDTEETTSRTETESTEAIISENNTTEYESTSVTAFVGTTTPIDTERTNDEVSETDTSVLPTYTLVVNYINRNNGRTIKEPDKYTYEEGQRYYLTAPSLRKFAPETNSLSGIIKGDTTITFYYYEVADTIPPESSYVTEFIGSTSYIVTETITE